jgi:uncharacterized RDD family membrane protein YckC
MAFPAWDREDQTSFKKNSKLEFKMPSLIDRQLAFYINFVLFSPWLALINVGLYGDLKIHISEFTLDNYAFFILFKMIFGSLLFLALLEAIYTFFWKATPGQMIFKLKVVDVQNTKTTFLQLFMRSVLWWLSLPFLVPLLAVHQNSQRRSFAELMTETMTITEKKVSDPGPSVFEKNLAQAWGSCFVLMLLFVFSIIVIEIESEQEKLSNSSAAIVNFKGEEQDCIIEGKSNLEKIDLSLAAAYVKKHSMNKIKIWPTL